MFNFFRKSKKDGDKKSKDAKESQSLIKEGAAGVQGKDVCKNNIPDSIQYSEIALENDVKSLPNYSPESVLRKNASNANSATGISLEKKHLNSETSTAVSPNPDIIATMCDNSVAAFKKPEPVAPMMEKRGSCVKPCGHGTTAISPRIPLLSGSNSNNPSPSSSPVLEVRKQFRITNIENLSPTKEELPKITVNNVADNDEDNNTLMASMKLHVNLPTLPDNNKVVENGVTLDKKNLINQEAKFQSQLNELSKQLSIRDADANKLKFEMEELQRDVFAKSAGMDRLETELNAAHKECELIRQRIRALEEELELYRINNKELCNDIENKTELLVKYETETKQKIEELEGVIKELRKKIESLEQELQTLQEDKIKLEQRHAELIVERDEERRKVEETLEYAAKQKQEIEKKWKEDFEKMRTVNILKEQQLLDDFEWKLREIQQTCKKKLEDKDKDAESRLQDAYREAEMKMKEAEAMMEKLENLKTYELEVKHLRNRTSDQERMMKDLLEQQEQMKNAEMSLRNETKKLRTLIDLEKENLQHMQRVHHQEILDKERKLQQTLNEKRTEIAMYWEERLLNECARLKNELEQIHNEEKWMAMEAVRKAKDESFQQAQKDWEKKLRECLKEVVSLKRSLTEKDEYYREELVSQQTNTDRDIIELRRLMDKIDMNHHDKYEKLVLQHDNELERINKEHAKKVMEVEEYWQTEVFELKAKVQQVKDQMERDAQQKIEAIIQQHRDALNEQWDNVIHQKDESIKLLEEEYVNKFRTLEEQLQIQQKSHSQREVELLKTIDSLKNEMSSKESTIDDLQNTVDTLEGGIQVLNREIAQQTNDLAKSKMESDQKIRGLLGSIAQLQETHEKEKEVYRLKLMSTQKNSQETIDHLQRKCQCLNKLFEEVRQRYERRESRQDDLNTISDLRQVIAEQEKDLACINEEKRYFQMRLMALEKHLEGQTEGEDEEFEDAHVQPIVEEPPDEVVVTSQNQTVFQAPNGSICIPPTIPECDDCDE